MKLSERDWKLSMLISRKPKNSAGDVPTRGLLVHRLRVGFKAVLRRPLAQGLESRSYGRYCEPCSEWIRVMGAPEQFECPTCQRIYVLEFAAYAVLPGSEPRVSRKEDEK